ncbi:MAG: hypothetical protein KatS3mg060_1517 [Dehalococcoidia bacterium]|nr:MAG: hypothetical protein KatS3mg060_1517 [Dehalococcoidia bacterium]
MTHRINFVNFPVGKPIAGTTASQQTSLDHKEPTIIMDDIRARLGELQQRILSLLERL